MIRMNRVIEFAQPLRELPAGAGLRRLVVVALAGLAFAPPALAALGAPAADASADGNVAQPAHMLRSGSPAQTGSTTVTTVTTPSGVTVREFAGSDGIVFAIAWSGPTIPDLETLFGSYFPAYRAWRQAHPGAGYRAPVAVRDPQIVAHAAGHMRAYSGSAYAPALVPPGVDLLALGVQP